MKHFSNDLAYELLFVTNSQYALFWPRKEGTNGQEEREARFANQKYPICGYDLLFVSLKTKRWIVWLCKYYKPIQQTRSYEKQKHKPGMWWTKIWWSLLLFNIMTFPIKNQPKRREKTWFPDNECFWCTKKIQSNQGLFIIFYPIQRLI